MSKGAALDSANPVEVRIKQLASAIQVLAGDDLNDYKLKCYQASCDAMRTLWNEAIDAARGAIIDDYYSGVSADSQRGAVSFLKCAEP